MRDFFKICLDLELLAKIKKGLVSTHSFFTFFRITQDLKKIKKNPEQPFLDIIKWKTCANFQRKKITSMVGGAGQNF